MARPTAFRDRNERVALRQAFQALGYEIIPLKSAEDSVLAHVPRNVRLTVTASPAKGQEVTIELTERLRAHGYNVAPHLSAQQIRDRSHLDDIVARLRAADVHEVFVIGGDPTDTPTEFPDAHTLLVALHQADHEFTDIGVGGHPEGHPAVSHEVLFEALAAKAPLAHHITTQICFDAGATARWADELTRRGIGLSVHVGIPGQVHRQKLLRVSAGLGIGESARFLKKQQHLLWRFFLPGGYSPDRLVKSLGTQLASSASPIAGFHVFTFNDLQATEAWRQKSLRVLSARPPADTAAEDVPKSGPSHRHPETAIGGTG